MNNSLSKKNSFIMYSEHKELVELLSDEQAGKLLKSIFEYTQTGETPDLDSMTKLVFISIRQTLDRNAEKYEDKVNRLRKNASLGGRHKKEENQIEENFSEKNQIEEKIFEKNQIEKKNFEKNQIEKKIFEKNQIEKNFFKKNQIESDNVYDNVNVHVNDNVLSLYNGEKIKILRERREISKEEREILEHYVTKNKLATKNLSAYVRKIIDNGDYLKILEKEKSEMTRKKIPKEQIIQEELDSIVDKHTCAKALYKYYSTGDFPPPEFDEKAEKYGITCYDDLYFYLQELESKKAQGP